MNLVKKGFTLIELLVVIGVLAVLMAGVVALIDPVDKNRQANDAVMQSLIANAATAEEAYAAQHDGCYALNWAALYAAGELKMNTPNTPTGYTAPTFTTVTDANCTTGTEIDSLTIHAVMMSKKYAGRTYWKYETDSGKTCAVATAATACP